MERQRGFSLIELLIVVAIILIIAAIAIPNLVRARISANEASAVNSMRTLNTAETTYAATYPVLGFGNLGELGGAAPCNPAPATACIVAEDLSGGSKAGYNFTAVADKSRSPSPSYTANGDPLGPTTGTRHFFTDLSGVIRAKVGGPATVLDSPI